MDSSEVCTVQNIILILTHFVYDFSGKLLSAVLSYLYKVFSTAG
jgi:hypothetical protein